MSNPAKAARELSRTLRNTPGFLGAYAEVVGGRDWAIVIESSGSLAAPATWFGFPVRAERRGPK